jgi:hypothetical protein
MARSPRRRSGGGRRAVPVTKRHADEKGKAAEVMTVMRLVISLWELIWMIVRDQGAGGGPGRIL